MAKSNRMKLFIDKGEIKIYKYKPFLFNFFHHKFAYNIKNFFRFFMEFFYGFNVYYFSINKKSVGYCVIVKGGIGRYKKFSSKDDIIVGPYYIYDQFRGNKYCELFVGELINKLNGYKKLTAGLIKLISPAYNVWKE